MDIQKESTVWEMKQSSERVVTTISIPEKKIHTFLAVKKIIEEEKLGTISSLFMEFIDERYSQISKSCSLDYFTPKLNTETKFKQIFLQAIADDKILWESMGKDIQEWVNKYNKVEQGRTFII